MEKTASKLGIAILLLAAAASGARAGEDEPIVRGELGKAVEKAGDPGMEAGVFLGPYELADGEFELSESLSLTVMPRDVGRGEDGKRVVGERITLVLTDAKAGQWPVMAKMDPVSARRLLSAVREALR